MSLAARWGAALNQLQELGRLRELRLAAGVDFTSNDYLGYGRRNLSPRRSFPVGKGVEGFSHSGTSSRLLRGHHQLWDDVESALAEWHGAEAVLMMTSGYSANEGLLSTVIGPGDWVAVDELVHASIIDGLRLSRPRKYRFRHNDLNQLEYGLREAAAKPQGGERFIVTESLFSMDGDLAPLSEIAGLADRYGAYLIVDEAHSTGCYGPAGAGCVDAARIRGRVLATVHTGGKALGAMGAYVCGSRLLKDFLVNKCRHLIFTTALPPAVAGWWLEMLGRIRADDDGRRTLHGNAASFRAALGEHGVPAAGSEYIVPIILGNDEEAVAAAARLQERGFDIRAIRPPSVPPGTARLRVSIHADHDRATLQRLAAAIAEAVRP